jgi:hypothetical protein
MTRAAAADESQEHQELFEPELSTLAGHSDSAGIVSMRPGWSKRWGWKQSSPGSSTSAWTV